MEDFVEIVELIWDLSLVFLPSILILILIVIAQRCSNNLAGIRDALKSLRNNLEDPEGRAVNVATELQGIHQQLRDIEYHTRKPPPAVED